MAGKQGRHTDVSGNLLPFLSMTEFKFPLAFTRNRFDSLPQFHWEEITCQDVVGQGTYGAVFISWYGPQDKPAEKSVLVNSPF